VAEACERSTSERLRALARASRQEISIHQVRTAFLLVFRNNPEIAATVWTTQAKSSSISGSCHGCTAPKGTLGTALAFVTFKHPNPFPLRRPRHHAPS